MMAHICELRSSSHLKCMLAETDNNLDVKGLTRMHPVCELITPVQCADSSESSSKALSAFINLDVSL